MQSDNWKLPAAVVVRQLPAEVKPYTKIVGRWVWVSFPAKPAAGMIDALRELGFHYNATRRAWQHCGGYRSIRSPGDPKLKYGAVKVEEAPEPAAVPA